MLLGEDAMRDDWFQLEIQRQALEAAEPTDDSGWVLPAAGGGDRGMALGIALTILAAALIVVLQSLIF
jgi:hypothetical protein